MSEDSELLRQFAEAKDQAAFTKLVQRHVNLVYSAAFRQVGGDDHLAWDACQGVFLALASSARSLVNHQALTGWLYTTTRNVCAKIVRSRQRAHAREKAASAMNDTVNHADAEPNWLAVREVIDAAMHELNGRDRDALLLRHFEGRSFVEIGHATSLSENAARMRVERALEKLRGCLARRGITSTATALATTLAAHGVSPAPVGLAAAAANFSLVGAAAAGASGAMAGIQLMTATQLKLCAAAAVCVIAAGGYFGLVALREPPPPASTASVAPARVQIDSRAPDNTPDPATAARGARPGSANTASTNPATAVAESATVNPFDPVAFNQTMRSAIRGALDRRYGELFRRMPLAPAEFEKFKDLLAERQVSTFDALGTAQKYGVQVSDPVQMQALLDRIRQDVDAGVRSLLGEERFQQYQEYNRNASSYGLLDQIRTRLSRTDEPLRPSQADALLDLLVRHAEPVGPDSFPGGAIGAGYVRAIGGDDPEAAAALRAPLSITTLTEAQGFLTAAQMETMRRFQSDQREHAEGMRSLMEKAVPPGNPGTNKSNSANPTH